MDQNLIGVTIASVVGVIGRVAVPSRSERIRNRLMKTLEVKERVEDMSGLDLVATHLDRTMEIQSAALLQTELLAAERRFDASAVFYALLLAGAFGYGAYLLWERDGLWWKAGAVVLGVLALAGVASGFEGAFKRKADDEAA